MLDKRFEELKSELFSWAEIILRNFLVLNMILTGIKIPLIMLWTKYMSRCLKKN
jgi:hypothetical protein